MTTPTPGIPTEDPAHAIAELEETQESLVHPRPGLADFRQRALEESPPPATPEPVAASSEPIRDGGTIRFFAGIAAFFLLCSGVVLALIVVVAALIPGWNSVFITSDSMAPHIRQGDIVIGGPIEEIRPGQVIVFHDPTGSGLVTHRVVEILDDGDYLTAGDANPSVDSTPVGPAAVIGAGRYLVPFVGWPLVWASDRAWVPLVLFGTTVVFLILLSRYGLFDEYAPARWREDSPPAGQQT